MQPKQRNSTKDRMALGQPPSPLVAPLVSTSTRTSEESGSETGDVVLAPLELPPPGNSSHEKKQ